MRGNYLPSLPRCDLCHLASYYGIVVISRALYWIILDLPKRQNTFSDAGSTTVRIRRSSHLLNQPAAEFFEQGLKSAGAATQ